MGRELEIFATLDLEPFKERAAAGKLDGGLAGQIGAARMENSAQDFATRGGPEDADWYWLGQWAHRCIAEIYLDRQFHWLAWALDRKQPGAGVAVFGENYLLDPTEPRGHACGTQGFPLKYTGQSKTAALSQLLLQWSGESVEDEVRLDEMEAVYKIDGYHPGRITKDFRRLSAFYEKAAAAKASLVVTLD